MITLHLLLHLLALINNKRVWEIDKSQLDHIFSVFQSLVKRGLFKDPDFLQEIGNQESQIHRMLAIAVYLDKLDIVQQLLSFKLIAEHAACNNNEALQAAFYPALPTRFLISNTDCVAGLPRLRIIHCLLKVASVKNSLTAELELNHGVTVQYIVYLLQAIQDKSLWDIHTRDFNIIKGSIIDFISHQGLLSDEFKKFIADRENPLHRLLAIVSYMGDVNLVDQLLSIREIRENAAYNLYEALRVAVYPNPSQLCTSQPVTVMGANNRLSRLLTFKEYKESLEREQPENQQEENPGFMAANQANNSVTSLNFLPFPPPLRLEQFEAFANEKRSQCSPDTYRNNSAVIERLLREEMVCKALFNELSPRRDVVLRNALSSLCIDSIMSVVKAYVALNVPLPLIKPLIHFFERLNLCHIRFLSQLERHFDGHVSFERELFYSHLLPYLQNARTKQDALWSAQPFDSPSSHEAEQSRFLLHIFNPDRGLNPPYQRVFQMIKKIRENKHNPDILPEMGERFDRINRLDAYQYLVRCAAIYTSRHSQLVVRPAHLSYESLNEAIEAYHRALLAPAAGAGAASSSSTSVNNKSRPSMS